MLLPLLSVLVAPVHAEEPAPAPASDPASTPAPPDAPVVGGEVERGPLDPSELPRTVPIHWSEAEVKVRATIRPSDYPAEALGLPDTACRVRVYVDEKGVPYDVAQQTCPHVFFPSARAIALRYRWYPFKRDGVATRVEFDLTMNFKAPPPEE